MEAIGEELRAIPLRARAVLEAAAVVGDPFDLDLVAAAGELDEDAIATALEVLIAQELVHPTGVPHRFALRHPLVRAAVYESAGVAWRPAAHGRVAAALAARGADAEALAHHVALSARPGDTEAVELLRTAATATLARAPATAIRWLRTAAALVEDRADERDRRVDVLVPLGTALTATGQLEAARSTLIEALELVDDGDGRRPGLVASCAALEHRLGRHGDADARLRSALAAVGDAPSRERLSLLLELAAGGFYAGDLEHMLAWAREAYDLAEALDDRPHAFAAAAALALAEITAEHSAAAEEHWRTAAAIMDGLSDEELAVRLDGTYFLSLAEMYLERFDILNAHASRALAVARASRQSHLLPGLTLADGWGALMSGDVRRATAVLEGAVEAARLTDNPFSLSWVLLNLTYACRHAGDADTALRAGEESVALAEQIDDNIVAGYPSAALADALAGAGNARRAVELILGGCGGPEVPLIRGFWRGYVLDLLTEVQLAVGDADGAAEAAERAAALGERLDTCLTRGWGARARARVALHAGDADAAARLALQAASDLFVGGAKVEAGRARILAGRALATAGRREEALAELRAAHELLEACGANAHREVAARELRRLGHRPARGDVEAAGLAALSAREREVATLIHAGRTNAQIAAELYLSKKTVESHVRNVFAKLRVSSRREVALAVERASA
jgi:DNA-binding NarL/FixJ family response regulator